MSLLSTDKASSPINLYGASKLTSDKLFVASNSYGGAHGTRFGIVRYGNVMGSRGSIIPFFLSLLEQGNTTLPITDERMTRFMITLEQGVDLVWHAFEDLAGGEIYVRKTPSMKVTDLAHAIIPGADFDFVGIRPGEKLHEQMVSSEEAYLTYEYDKYYKILPAIHNWCRSLERIKEGKLVENNFIYDSGSNKDWMSVDDMSEWVRLNKKNFMAVTY